MHISNTNEYLFLTLYTCMDHNPPMNLVKFCQDQNKMVDFFSFLFAQIDKIFENFVRPDDYLQHQWILVSDTLHMDLLQSSHQPCEVSSGSKSKWPTYRHFCCLKLTKYLKTLSALMNISNTNEYIFFPIIYTCIYYNPPMNPYNLQQSFNPVGDTIALAIYLFRIYWANLGEVSMLMGSTCNYIGCIMKLSLDQLRAVAVQGY